MTQLALPEPEVMCKNFRNTILYYESKSSHIFCCVIEGLKLFQYLVGPYFFSQGPCFKKLAYIGYLPVLALSSGR